MQLEIGILQDICDQIANEIDAVVTIIGGRGRVIASSKRTRIGDLHANGAKIMVGEIDSFSVTAEEAARSISMLEGCAAAIDFEGERLFCVAVAAPIDDARRYIRIVRHWVLSHLRAAKAQAAYDLAIKASEERFRDVADTAGDWIYEMNADLRFTYISDRFFEIFPVRPEQVIGKTRQEFAGRELDEPHWKKHYSELAAHRPFRNFAYNTAMADGSVRYLQISGKPVFGADGDFAGYRGTGSDVTDLKLREQEVTLARQRLLEAIETISEGFALYDDQDRLILCNSHYHKLMRHDAGSSVEIGDKFESIVRRAIRNGLIPAAQEDPEKWIRERVAKHRDPSEPVVVERSDGTWYQISERKTRDGGVVVVFSDITNMKRHEAELEASNQRFRDVAEVSGDWLYEMDEDLRFTYISDRFFEILPVAREALIGRTRQEFAGKALEVPHWQAHYRDLNARKPFRNFEYDVTLPNKELRFLQISGKPVFALDGTFKGYRGTGTDITELRLREQQLAAERERLRRVTIEVSEKNSMLETLSGKLAKYLPPQVYATIFSGAQDVKVVSQRKKLTVFFSDITGFTEITDKMESEDLTQLLNEYLTEMSLIALSYGATIDKYIGDAVMIFFGDPESRGVTADALTCVKMAVAMQKRVRQLASIWRDAGIERPLSCRMGIHTGYCTVGNFGSEDRVSYTAIGSGVNLASRLESEAPPGEILISYETYAHVKDEISCEEVGRIRVKGFADPITTYRVIDDFQAIAHEGEAIAIRLPHISINVDPRRMNATEQEEARQLLQKALERLGAPIQDPAPDSPIPSAPASNPMHDETISRLRTKKRRRQK
jgi:PAS domain S-box-containing protein